MSKRKSLDADLAAEVMFASDRTCCVCRLNKDKVQVHHIDKDSSNNVKSNLAVICLYCHSDAHTNGAFVRNLTPELITLYNNSWREIVKSKHNPSETKSEEKEYISEALLEVSLDCHSWKNYFMSLTPPDRRKESNKKHKDVWELFTEEWVPEYSAEQFLIYKPLFSDAITDLQRRFDRVIQIFSGTLPFEFRTKLVRASRQLRTESVVYFCLDSVIEEPQKNLFFKMRFTEVIRVLSEISRDADKKREFIMSRA